MRKGKWIETVSGIKFWPLDPKPEDICVVDIATGLCQTCRYNGQVMFFYSVGQHSLNCCQLAEYMGHPARVQLLCLLHDAAEAYISDVTAPVKSCIPEFSRIEEGILQAVYKSFRMDPPTPEELKIIKNIDNVILVTEAKGLAMEHVTSEESLVRFLPHPHIKIQSLPPDVVIYAYLDVLAELLVETLETDKLTEVASDLIKNFKKVVKGKMKP